MSLGNEDYDVTNRAFMQAFMGHSTLTFEEAKPIIAAIFSAHQRREFLVDDITEDDFNRYVSKANQALSPFDMEIRSTLHQITRIRVWALVNSTSDAMSQLATSYTADEIGFLKRILDYMFETNNMPRSEVQAIKSTQALNLAKQSNDRGESHNSTEMQGSAGQGLTMSQAENMLKNLVHQGWFEKSRKGYYSLSPRALMELRGWLTDTYNENDDSDDDDQHLRIKFCYACKDIVTTGQRCPMWRCQCRIHDICTNNFFTSQRSRNCPLCMESWTGEDFVGERADNGTTSSSRKRRSWEGRVASSGTQANAVEEAVANDDGETVVEREGENHEMNDDNPHD